MPGAFRAAEGGTVFLDEIAELDAGCQAKLLRVLQQRVVTPVGSHEEIPVNVRIVAATNRDLAAEVKAGRFRADLYYRLSVIVIEALPLCARREDIPLLAAHFVEEVAAIEQEPPRSLTTAAIAELTSHPWPGNVRQLRNVIERAVIFAQGASLDAGLTDAAAPVVDTEPDARTQQSSAEAMRFRPENSGEADRSNVYRMPTVAESERIQILTAMQSSGYNQSRAADMLGVTRQQLRRRIEKHFPESLPSKRGRPQSKKLQRSKAA
jgi:DNA-binding NtrC family response regulator